MCSVNRSVLPKAWIWKMTTGCMQNSPGVATCTEVWTMNCILKRLNSLIVTCIGGYVFEFVVGQSVCYFEIFSL